MRTPPVLVQLSGGGVHRAHFGLIGEESKGGGLDAANSPHADAELLRGGLKRGWRLAE
jgi:hypothetical protein